MKKAISESVKALSHTPQYKMHKYFARRPYNVFSNIIDHYSEEGQTILDIFCGGGVTVFEGVKLKRNVIGVDLNPLATFITRMQMFNGNYDELQNNINFFINKIVDSFSKVYDIAFDDDYGNCEWVEWTYVVNCPACGHEIILLEDNKVKNGFYRCPNPNCKCSQGVARTKCKSNGSVPVRVKYISSIDNKEKIKVFSNKEIDVILNQEESYLKKSEDLIYPNFNFPMNWDRQKEDKLYEKGIIKYSDLFSAKNLYVLGSLFKFILEEKKKGNPYADYLYFTFSSTLRYTNKMSKITENWEGGNPTCMDKHAYYLPNSFIENNVVNVFKERAKLR